MRDAMACGLLDQIITPAAGNRVEPGVDWVADNGIYSHAYPGDYGYLLWLQQNAVGVEDRCRFAVAPDVVADHDATLARSWPMLRRIRETVGAVALCAQNGATPDDLPWDYIDAVFLAGIKECARCSFVPDLSALARTARCPNGHRLAEWKLSPAAIAVSAEAARRGKWLHMGRVNSWQRLRYARWMGCDSVDGTYLRFGPNRNLARLLRWLAEVNDQALIWEAS